MQAGPTDGTLKPDRGEERHTAYYSAGDSKGEIGLAQGYNRLTNSGDQDEHAHHLDLSSLQELCDKSQLPAEVIRAAVLADSADLTDKRRAESWLLALRDYISELTPIERLCPVISPFVSPSEFVSLETCVRRHEILEEVRRYPYYADAVAHGSAWWQVYKAIEHQPEFKNLNPLATATALTFLMISAPSSGDDQGSKGDTYGISLRSRLLQQRKVFNPLSTRTDLPSMAYNPYVLILLGAEKLIKLASGVELKRPDEPFIARSRLFNKPGLKDLRPLLDATVTHNPEKIEQSVLELVAAKSSQAAEKKSAQNKRRKLNLTPEALEQLKLRTTKDIHNLETTLSGDPKSIKANRVPSETQSIVQLINNIKNAIETALDRTIQTSGQDAVVCPSSLGRSHTRDDLQSFWNAATLTLRNLKHILDPDSAPQEQPEPQAPELDPKQALLEALAEKTTELLARTIGTENPFLVSADYDGNRVVAQLLILPEQAKAWQARLPAIRASSGISKDVTLELIELNEITTSPLLRDSWFAPNTARRESILPSEVKQAADYLRDAFKINYPDAWAEIKTCGNSVIFSSHIKLSEDHLSAIAEAATLLPVPIIFQLASEPTQPTFTNKALKRLVTALTDKKIYVISPTRDESGKIKIRFVTTAQTWNAYLNKMLELAETLSLSGNPADFELVLITAQVGSWLNRKHLKVATRLAQTIDPDGLIGVPKATAAKNPHNLRERTLQLAENQHNLPKRTDIKPFAIDRAGTAMREGAISVKVAKGQLLLSTHFYNLALVLPEFDTDRMISLRRGVAIYGDSHFVSRINNRFTTKGFNLRSYAPSITTTYSIPLDVIDNPEEILPYLKSPHISLDMIKLAQCYTFDNYPESGINYPEARKTDRELLSLVARAFLSRGDDLGITNQIDLRPDLLDHLLITISNAALSRFVRKNNSPLLYNATGLIKDERREALSEIIATAINYLKEHGTQIPNHYLDPDTVLANPPLASQLVMVATKLCGVSLKKADLLSTPCIFPDLTDIATGERSLAKFNCPVRRADALANQHQVNSLLTGHTSAYGLEELKTIGSMMGRAKGTKNERLEDEILLDTLNKLSELGGTAITAKVKLADLAEEQYEQPSRVELDVELNFTQGYRCLLQCSPEQISALADRATIRVRAVGYSIPDQALIFTSFSNSPSHDPGS